jgi:predicted RNA-binding protein with PIN domain
MRYLIDGYNLLFASGRLTPRAGRGALEASRKWLLVEVVRWHGTQSADVTVVFDAAGAPPGTPLHEDHGDVRVRFARGQTADDLIEELIRDESAPRLLTVVSDDNRIKEAARRRGCVVLGCLDYCERWSQPHRDEAAPPSVEPAKPDSMSEQERRDWLEAFKDVEDGDAIEPI